MSIEAEAPMTFSFCEAVTAGAATPWHIRRLDEAGRKLGGGITTPFLCGRKVSGWDLDVPFDERHFSRACSRCIAAYREVEP